MAVKRLRKVKTLNSKNIEEISSVAKNLVLDALRKQQIETMKLPVEYGDVADEINRIGYSFLRYIYEINEYFTVVSGKTEEKRTKIEICSFTNELCKRAEKFTIKKEIKLFCNIPEEKIFVHIDRERFLYAFYSIILNAAENSSVGGKIRISISSTKKFVKISVRDNGAGMSEETLIHCREPFFTFSRENKIRKLGLGLTLTHYFTADIKGRLNLSSEEGKGTSVALLIPLMKKEEQALYVESPESDIAGGKILPEYVILSGIGEDE